MLMLRNVFKCTELIKQHSKRCETRHWRYGTRRPTGIVFRACSRCTETVMLSFWQQFRHWLHRKLSNDNFRCSQWRKFRQNDISLTYQNASRRSLSRDELTGPVFGFCHPADLGIGRLQGTRLLRGARLGDSGLILAAEPCKDAPRQDEQQPDEESDKTGAEESIPVPIFEASVARCLVDHPEAAMVSTSKRLDVLRMEMNHGIETLQSYGKKILSPERCSCQSRHVGGCRAGTRAGRLPGVRLLLVAARWRQTASSGFEVDCYTVSTMWLL